MKLLVFGDTHGISDFSYLDEMAQEADVILHIGDLTDFGIGMAEALEGLSDLQRRVERPVVITHGNHEHDLREHIKDFDNLNYVHESVWVRDELAVFGFGGGGFSEHEPRVEEFFEKAYDDHSTSSQIHVWLFHGPPFDMAVDVRPDWGPTGSLTKRSLIEKHNPHFVFVGHIHEAWGVVHQHKQTVLVNPGPEGVLLDVDVTRR